MQSQSSRKRPRDAQRPEVAKSFDEHKEGEGYYPCIKYADFDPSIAREKFRDYGVLVVTDVFTGQQCDRWMDEIVRSLEQLGTGVNRDDLSTWTKDRLPPCSRIGLFQTLVGHSRPVWDIRCQRSLQDISAALYGDNDLLVSMDGINIVPNGMCLRRRDKMRQGVVDYWTHDWAHVDQTVRSGTLQCVQSQVVLTNTSACFRASPRSHKVHKDLMEICGISHNNSSNWCQVKKQRHVYDQVRQLVMRAGGSWQIPIHAPRGSVILWASTVLHSALHADRVEESDPTDPWKGWRGVVYTCFRPRKCFRPKDLERRERALRENRLMSHWSSRLFPVVPGRGTRVSNFHPEIQTLIKDTTRVYEKWNAPNPPMYFERMHTIACSLR